MEWSLRAPPLLKSEQEPTSAFVFTGERIRDEGTVAPGAVPRGHVDQCRILESGRDTPTPLYRRTQANEASAKDATAVYQVAR